MIRPFIQLAGATVALVLAAGSLHSEGLAQALFAALANHPGPAGKAAEVQGAEARLREARAARLPSVSTRLGNDDSAVVTLRQPLYAFDRINRSIASSKADLLREEADLQQVRRQLLEDTALAYSDVLTARARVAQHETYVTELETAVGAVARRASAKLATDADVRLAEVRLSEARGDLARARNEFDLALAGLRHMTVVETTPIGDVEDAYLEVPDPETLAELARSASALLAVKRAAVDAAAASAAHARRASAPTVYAEVSQSLSGESDTQVGVFLSYEIDGLGTAQRARNGAGEADIAAATKDLEMAENEVAFAVEEISLAQSVAQSLINLQKETLASYDAAVASHERLYAAGQLRWSDVLGIYRERHEHKVQLAELEGELRSASLRMAAMLGRLDPSE